MNEGRLDEAELIRVVAALSEVGVLVDGAGDQAGDLGDLFGVGAEDEGEGGRECGGGLHGGEAEFGDIVAGDASAGADSGEGKQTYLSPKPKVPLIWLIVVRLPMTRTFLLNAPPWPPSTKSVSMKMKVFLTSKPIAMMSMAFCSANLWQSSRESLGE